MLAFPCGVIGLVAGLTSVATYDLQGCSAIIELVRALKNDRDAATVSRKAPSALDRT